MKIIQSNITNIGDPFILVYKNTYYHYSTSSECGFIVYSSSDLLSWNNHGHCYLDSKVGDRDFWAPEVYFFKDEFYLFFSVYNNKLGRLVISLAKTKSPLGPFIDVKDEPTFDFGYPAIDPTVFFDDDSRVYMYYAKDCSENIVDGIHKSEIYVIELSSDLLTTIGQAKLLLTPTGEYETKDSEWQWNEGPSVLKKNGLYYLSYSTNCYTSKYYSVCYATSKSPFGPFIKAKENPILSFIDGLTSGPGHNAYFKSIDGELMTSYHVHTDIDRPSGNRRTCFSKCYFENNKLIIDYK